MSLAPQIRAAAHLLAVVENGSHSLAQMRMRYEEADPALVYLLFSWLRARYPPSHSAHEGVIGRIAAVCGASRAVASKVRQGEKDAVVTWLEAEVPYRSLDREAFLALVVEKLEG